MYSVKIRNNIQNLFSVLDSTVPGSSPYAVNKTVSNSDNGFTLNVNQGNINPVVISLIQGSSSERFTIGTAVTSGNYRYVWFFRNSSTGTVKRQIANINFSNGSIINSLPINPNSTGYVSYNHPDSSVYTGIIGAANSLQIPIAITVYDTNTIARASLFTCTQVGIVFIAFFRGGNTDILSSTTLINVGESLNSIMGEVLDPFFGPISPSPTILADEITNVTSGTSDLGDTPFVIVYSTAIFSITF